jgi:hypothetical protein
MGRELQGLLGFDLWTWIEEARDGSWTWIRCAVLRNETSIKGKHWICGPGPPRPIVDGRGKSFVLDGLFAAMASFPIATHDVRAEGDTGSTLWYEAQTTPMKCERILCMRSKYHQYSISFNLSLLVLVLGSSRPLVSHRPPIIQGDEAYMYAQVLHRGIRT